MVREYACRKEEGEPFLPAATWCSLFCLRVNVMTIARQVKKLKRSCSDLGITMFTEKQVQVGGFHCIQS